MPAQGKTNASRVEAGERILVRATGDRVELSTTKTGAGVQVARVNTKEFSQSQRYGGRGTYILHTSAGTIYGLAPIQTMWLAPEDPAGVKRAHAEAQEEDRERQEAARHAETREAIRETGELVERTEAKYPAEPTHGGADLVADGQTPALAVALALEVKVPTLASLDLDTQKGLNVAGQPVGVRLVTAAPGPEDLSDLARSLTEEDREHLEPEEVRVPKDPALRCQVRDVVTIHRGDRLYLVERVEADSSRNNLTGEVADHTMALVSPVDPEDERPAQWVHVDLLHVRQPVARVWTVEVTGRVRQTREVFRAVGQDALVVVRTILVDSRRVPHVTLVEVPSYPVGQETTLRVGEALVVDGRCFAVAEGCDGELVLDPAPHRDRLHQPGPREPEARAEAIRDWQETNRYPY